MPFELRLTDLGRAALADGDNRGTQAVRLTKMAIGDGSGTGGAPNDGRAALRSQRAVVALGGTTMVSGRIAVRGEFTPGAAYGVTELGLLGQVGTDPEFLAAYWTDGGERLASTVANTRLVIAGSLDIAPAAAEVTVTLDASVSLGDPALSATVTALGGRLDTAESDIDALEGRLDTAETDIDALEAAGFGALITALAARVTTLEGQEVGVPATQPEIAVHSASVTDTNWITVVDHLGAGFLWQVAGLLRYFPTATNYAALDVEITIDGGSSRMFPRDDIALLRPGNAAGSPYYLYIGLRFATRLRIRVRPHNTAPPNLVRATVTYSTDI